VPGVEGGTVELGSGDLVTIRMVVEKLAELINSSAQPVFGALPDRPMERIRAAQATLTHQQIGWRSRTTMDEGLRATIDWYRSTLGN